MVSNGTSMNKEMRQPCGGRRQAAVSILLVACAMTVSPITPCFAQDASIFGIVNQGLTSLQNAGVAGGTQQFGQGMVPMPGSSNVFPLQTTDMGGTTFGGTQTGFNGGNQGGLTVTGVTFGNGQSFPVSNGQITDNGTMFGGGSNTNFGGTSTSFGGTNTNFGGTNTNFGGTNTNFGGTNTNTGGTNLGGVSGSNNNTNGGGLNNPGFGGGPTPENNGAQTGSANTGQGTVPIQTICPY